MVPDAKPNITVVYKYVNYRIRLSKLKKAKLVGF